MDISSLIDLNLELKENTDRLFYDQYQYSLKLRMKDFSCLREIRNTDKNLVQAAATVIKRQEQRANYSKFFTTGYRSVSATKKLDLENLLHFLELIWSFKDRLKLVFSGDWGYVYSNDKQLLKLIGRQVYIHVYYIKQAVINRPKDTILLQSSPYQYRSFLREQQFAKDDKDRIQAYLENQPDIKISRGLRYWLKYETRWHWTRRYHYFDHNDEKIGLMLQLMYPGIIRTTMPIIKVNN
jgi:hypothetical protein